MQRATLTALAIPLLFWLGSTAPAFAQKEGEFCAPCGLNSHCDQTTNKYWVCKVPESGSGSGSNKPSGSDTTNSCKWHSTGPC
jgi:hypothetical protein